MLHQAYHNGRNLLLVLAFILTGFALQAQLTSYEGINYQAIIRNADGQVLSGQGVTLRITIYQKGKLGDGYIERHQTSTNLMGLVVLKVGDGIPEQNHLDSVRWEEANTAPFFMKVELDESGGQNYRSMGESELLSVPYSFFAREAGRALNDEDTSTTNEIQTLVYDPLAKTLTLTGPTSNVIDLSHFLDTLHIQQMRLDTIKDSLYLFDDHNPPNEYGIDMSYFASMSKVKADSIFLSNKMRSDSIAIIGLLSDSTSLMRLALADTANTLRVLIGTPVQTTDTAGMLFNYIARGDTSAMLQRYIARGDTNAMLQRYIARGDTANMLQRLIARGDTAAMLLNYIARGDTAGMLQRYIARGDTSSMLQPYVARGDTADMLLNYIARGDTASMLLNYITRGDTSAMLQNYISRGDTATMLQNYIGRGDTASMLQRYIARGDTAAMLDPYLRALDTNNLSNRINVNASDIATLQTTKLNAADTASLSDRIDDKLNLSDTASMLSNYLLETDTASLSDRIDDKLNLSDTASMLSNYLLESDTASLSDRIDDKLNLSDTASMLSKYLLESDTASLSDRIDDKLNLSDTASMLGKYLLETDTASLSDRIDDKLNLSDTASMLGKYLLETDTASLSDRIDDKLNLSDTASMLSKYLLEADTASLSDRINTLDAKVDAGAFKDSSATNEKIDSLYLSGNDLITVEGGVNVDTVDLSLFNGNSNLADTASALRALISTNASDITSLQNTKLNASDTASLNNRINTNASGITTNASDITNLQNTKLNATDTASLSDRITTNVTNITTNASDITNLQNTKLSGTDTVSLSNRINTNASGIVTNAGDITNLQNTKLSGSDTVSLSNRINTNVSEIATNSGDITNLQNTKLSGSDTVSLSNRINTNVSGITTNAGDITNLQNTKLNATDTASLSSRINTNVTGVAANASDITNLQNSKLNAADTASLSSRINDKLNISDTASMLAPYLRSSTQIDTSGLGARVDANTTGLASLTTKQIADSADLANKIRSDSTILAGRLDDLDAGAYKDSSATNELQNLSLNLTGDSILINGGGGVSIAHAIAIDTISIIQNFSRSTYVDANSTGQVLVGVDDTTEYTFYENRIDKRQGSIYMGTGAGEFDPQNYHDSISNVGIGYHALNLNNGNSGSVAIGAEALQNNGIVGPDNTAVGNQAMKHNFNGANNVAVGKQALKNSINPSGNVAIGSGSLLGATTGNGNTAIGTNAGSGLTSGGGNVFLGSSAGTIGSYSNQLFINNGSSATPLIWGDFDNDSLKIFGNLSIGNEYSFPDTAGKNGQLLGADVNGNPVWKDAAGDNLGDHTATQNIQTNGNHISYSGGNQGLYLFNGSGAAIDTNQAVSDEALTVRSGTNSWGIMNTDGVVSMGTWLFTGTAGQLGTFSKHRLDFITNNSAPIMTIDTNGNVSIGATDQPNKFYVRDNFSVTSGGYEMSRYVSAGTNTSATYQRGFASYIGGAAGENEAIFAYSHGTSSGVNRGIYAVGDSATENRGIVGVAGATPAGANFAMGVQGFAEASSDGINYGVYGSSANSSFINRGVVGVMGDTTATSNDAAVYGIANGRGENISIYGRAASTNASGINYGIYSRAENADTNYAFYGEAGNVFIRDTLILPTGAGSGRVLTSDADGYARWSTLPSVDTLPLIKVNDSNKLEISSTELVLTFNNDDALKVDSRGRINNTDNSNNNIYIGGAAGIGHSTFNDHPYRANVGIGAEALNSVTAGEYNTAIGTRSMVSTTGPNNTAVGNATLMTLTTGMDNSAFGYLALNSTTGSNSSAFGAHALRLSKTGINDAFGTRALENLTSGTQNVAFGYNALTQDTSGFQNVAIGYESGYSSKNGSGNIFLGFRAGYHELGSNKLYIDNSDQSTPLIYGDFNNDSIKIYGTLSVGNNYTFPTGGPANSGEVLTYNGSGLVWQAPASISLGDTTQIADGDGNTYVRTEESNNEDIIRFATGGSERMRIDDAGNLSVARKMIIGDYISTPTRTLHVVGTAEIDSVDAEYLRINANDSLAAIISTNSGSQATGTQVSLSVQNTGGVGGLESTVGEFTNQSGGQFNYGISGSAINASTANIGVIGGASSNGGIEAYGVSGTAFGGGSVNYGVYGTATDATVNWAGYFDDGNVFIQDTLFYNVGNVSSGHVLTSDAAGRMSLQALPATNLGDTTQLADLDNDTRILTDKGGSDEDMIRFEIAGKEYYRMDSVRLVFTQQNGENTFIGHDAGSNITIGSVTGNTMVGAMSGNALTIGDRNTGFGRGTMALVTSGSNNTAMGYNALLKATTAGDNTAVGYQALNVTTGGSNTAVGSEAMSSNAAGSNNVAMGYAALSKSTSGSSNTVIGYFAKGQSSTGKENVAIGYQADMNNQAGSLNVVLGFQAGYGSPGAHDKSGNLMAGYQAGYTNTGDKNIFLGYQAGYNETGSNLLYIDNSNTSTPLIWGDMDKDSLRFNSDVVVTNDFYVDQANVAENKIIRANSQGQAVWYMDTLVCPAGFDKVNENFCIHSSEQAAATWFVATETCASNGYELSTYADWYSATAILTLTDEADDWEWMSNISQNNMLVAGNGDIKNRTFQDPASTTAPYRCVYRKQ
ncbi:hypothetical protein KFE98_15890 [bacterium SCSIO 12741]|nr:hypothetical protein KFE98_15890 [bacterium SCSIO 12741]